MRKALLIALVAGLLFPAGASACTIAARPAKDRVAEAKVAVFGRVVEREQLEADGTNPLYRYRFRVIETYKGRIRRRMTLLGRTDTGTCEAGLLKVGDRFGLVLGKRRGPWKIATPDFISRSELRSVRRPRRG